MAGEDARPPRTQETRETLSSIALVGAIELGLVYAFVGLAVFLAFRILDFPDLTVDGSFPLGAAWRRSRLPPGSIRGWQRRWRLAPAARPGW